MTTLLPRTTWYEDSAASAELANAHIQKLDVAGYHLSETRHPAGSRIPIHSHQTYSVYFLLEGSLTEHFGRQRVDREAKQLIFTPADEPHSNEFRRHGGRCFFFELNPSVVSWAKDHGSLPTGPTLLQGPLPRLARRLYAEFRRADVLFPLIVESIGLEMIAEICRRQSPPRRGRPPAWLHQAKELLDAHFSEPASLAETAHVIGSHPVHLARMFRRYYGCSVGEYVRLRRIEFACSELSRTEAPLAQIAVTCGFFDQSHFCKTFRALVGVTPSQYRSASGRR
ncbi:MAG: AraC family transcriptional regulator [Acidobacteriia bacterium]|nr:AraC family transcriptional regulator [Terriglobia bacterium]